MSGDSGGNTGVSVYLDPQMGTEGGQASGIGLSGIICGGKEVLGPRGWSLLRRPNLVQASSLMKWTQRPGSGDPMGLAKLLVEYSQMAREPGAAPFHLGETSSASLAGWV